MVSLAAVGWICKTRPPLGQVARRGASGISPDLVAARLEEGSRLGLVIALLLRSGRIAIVVILRSVILRLRLRIGLRAIDPPAAARRRVTRLIRAAVGRIDVAVIGPLLRRDLASGQQLRLRRQPPGLAGIRTLLLLRGRRGLLGRRGILRGILAGDGGVGAARIARERDLG